MLKTHVLGDYFSGDVACWVMEPNAFFPELLHEEKENPRSDASSSIQDLKCNFIIQNTHLNLVLCSIFQRLEG